MPRFFLAAMESPAPMPGLTAEQTRNTELFTAELLANGQLIYAGELSALDDAVNVAPTGRLGDGPVGQGPTQLAGFWIVEVANRAGAEAVAVRAAAACGRKIELRPLQKESY